MNKLRLIRNFAFFIVFCAAYVSSESWPSKVRRLLNEASTVEPSEKMKVYLQNISFERGGQIVESYAHESLTLIANEHLVRRNGESSNENSSELRVYYKFIIEMTNSDRISEWIFTFWSLPIKKFVYFVSTSGSIKLMLLPEYNKGIIAVHFLNPRDAQLFWYYASKNRTRRGSHAIDVLKFEIFNRQSGEKLEESLFAVIHKEWAAQVTATYTISVRCREEDMPKPLLIFTSKRFSISHIIEDRIGLRVSDEPNLVFILQFSPFDYDAAAALRQDLYPRRSETLDPISNDDLRAFID